MASMDNVITLHSPETWLESSRARSLLDDQFADMDAARIKSLHLVSIELRSMAKRAREQAQAVCAHSDRVMRNQSQSNDN